MKTKTNFLIATLAATFVAFIGMMMTVNGLSFPACIITLVNGEVIYFSISWWWNVLLVFIIFLVGPLLYRKRVKEVNEMTACQRLFSDDADTGIIAALLLSLTTSFSFLAGFVAMIAIMFVIGLIIALMKNYWWENAAMILILSCLFSLWISPVIGIGVVIANVFGYILGVIFEKIYSKNKKIWSKV